MNGTGYKKNPVPLMEQVRTERARRAFERFTGSRAQYVDEVDDVSNVAWKMGNVEFIGYSTVRDGVKERYVHDFKKRRPTLAASHDGKSAHILGGGFEITERGFEDR